MYENWYKHFLSNDIYLDFQRTDYEAIQNDFDEIIQYSEKRQMPFDLEKHKVVNTGSENKNDTYSMCGKPQ